MSKIIIMTGIKNFRLQEKMLKVTLMLISLSMLMSCAPQVNKITSLFSREKPGEAKKTHAREREEINRPIKLTIPNFEKMGGDKRFDFLSHSLPELLAVSLITNDKVQYVNQDHFWQLAAKKYSREQLQTNRNLIFSEDFLKEADIDLVVKGRFLEYRGKISLEATLEDRINKKIINISSSIVDVREIYSGVERFAKELNAEILALESEKAEHRIAVLCFKDTSVKPSGENKWMGMDIALSLVLSAHLPKGMAILPWNETKKLCERDETSAKISETANLDALIRGDYSISQDEITIKPTLYVKKSGSLIPLTLVKGKIKEEYLEVMDNLASDAGDVLNAVFGEDGDLDLKALEFASEDPVKFLEKGKEYKGQKKNTYIAALMFIKAIKLKPDLTEAHYLLGLMRARQKRYREAVREFELAIKTSEKATDKESQRLRATAFEGIGDIYLETSEYSKALEMFKKASQIAPDPEGIDFKIGATYYFLGKPKEAAVYLEKAFKADPENSNICNMLASAYKSIGSAKGAANLFSDAGKMSPDSISSAFFCRGHVFAELEKHDKAIEQFSKVIELEPKNAAAYNYRGFVYERLQKYDRAIEDFNKAVELDSKFGDAYLNLSEAYIITGNYKRALENISKSLPILTELKHRAINFYLECIARKLLGIDGAEAEAGLNEMLKKEFTVDWSFDEIESWLKNADISEDVRTYIRKKTEMLKRVK